MPGMRISEITTGNGCSSKRASASAALSHSTTSQSCAIFKKKDTPWRLIASSSTNSIRMGLLDFYGQREPHAEGRTAAVIISTAGLTLEPFYKHADNGQSQSGSALVLTCREK